MPVRIKICGVTTAEDARLVAQLGADAVGINFYSGSPRFVRPEQAAPILRALPPFVDAVGVFVGLNTRQVCALAYQLGLGSIQCLADLEDMDDPFPFRRIAAFRVKDEGSLDEIRRYIEKCRAAGSLPGAVLIDSHVEGQLGGTGRVAPWELLRGFDPGVPIILAGGLTPDNVVEAIATVQPYGVDVASGVESAPGRKDPEKLRRFVNNAKGES